MTDTPKIPDVGNVVWVVERGCYSTKFVDGVFASMDAVREAYPDEKWEPETNRWDINPTPSFYNGKYGDDSLAAYPYKVQG